jgi:hypothetical protein
MGKNNKGGKSKDANTQKSNGASKSKLDTPQGAVQTEEDLYGNTRASLGVDKQADDLGVVDEEEEEEDTDGDEPTEEQILQIQAENELCKRVHEDRAKKTKGQVKRKRKGMAYPLMMLAGALSLSYLLPKLMRGFDLGFPPNTPPTGWAMSKPLPVCHKGTVIITDAAYGHARETALLLADQGMHVLAGVRSAAEERSFAYDERKGLEPFQMDLQEPNEVAKLMYRLRFITVEMERPLYGIIVNTADSSLDASLTADMQSVSLSPSSPYGSDGSSRSFNSMNLRHISEVVTDVPRLDSSYRLQLQGQLRVVQAGLEVLSDAMQIHESTLPVDACVVGMDGLCTPPADSEAQDREVDSSKTQKKKSRKAKTSAADAQLCKTGATARLLFMTLDTAAAGLESPHPGALKKKQANRSKKQALNNSNTTTSTMVCGTPCVMNKALESYAEQLDSALWDSKVMVSRISVSSKPYRNSEVKDSRVEAKIAKKAQEIGDLSRERQWVELNDDVAEADDSENNAKARKATKAERKAERARKRLEAEAKKNPHIIDKKYSLEANQAAHAILSSRPLQFYNDHQKPKAQPRKKFLGL